MNRCKICRKVIPDPIPTVGLPFINQVSQNLAEHITRDHPDIGKQLHMMSMHQLGTMMLLQFETTDVELAKQIDMSRWSLLQQAKGPELSKAEIQAFVDSFNDATLQRVRMGQQITPEFIDSSVLSLISKVYARALEAGKYRPVDRPQVI